MKAIKEIVAPIDLEEHSEKLIEYTAYIAEKLGANISFVHVVEPYPSVGDIDLGTDTMQEFTRMRLQYAEKTLSELAEKYPNCSTKILKGVVADEVIDYAKRKEAGLIVIGTHGTKGIEKLLLGSVAERVVKNAHCPTLVMNPFKQ